VIVPRSCRQVQRWCIKLCYAICFHILCNSLFTSGPVIWSRDISVSSDYAVSRTIRVSNRSLDKLLFFSPETIQSSPWAHPASYLKDTGLLLLLLFLTAIGFSAGGSSLTPVQTPQYNNSYLNGTAPLQYTYLQFTHKIQCAYTNTNIPT
jgi:hypothetical protein